MRVFAVLLCAAGLAFTVACGSNGSGSTPVGVPSQPTATVAVSTGGQSLLPGGSLQITATVTTSASNTGVTWSLSGPGSLSSTTANPVTYTAPSSGVAANTDVVVTATAAADSTATAYVPLTILPPGTLNGGNSAPLAVNAGPAGNSLNIAFVSVTVCNPGTTTCATIDDIQVDTGSSGLRLLQSAIPASISLPTLTDTSGNTIDNCVAFADGSFLWGPVQQADLKINGEVSGGALIQTIASSNSGVPSACTGTTLESTPALLGANGIIGIGTEPTDCELAGSNLCDGSVFATPPPIYFSCPSTGCASSASPITLSAQSQVVNPVVLFATDNNGTAITFPAVVGPAATAAGTVTFGIGTQTNNALGSATVYGLDINDNFITLYNGQTLTASFIDSGSNGLFFPSSIAVCASPDQAFYCPASLIAQTANNEGATGAPVSPTVNFSIDNADTLLAMPDTAFDTLGGPNGTANTCSNGTGSCSFDWGLPFFYGRTVFTAIDGQAVSGGVAPFWAY